MTGFQTIKLFIVNKSDREGSDRLAQSIRNVLHIFKNKDNHEPPVFKVSANSGNGIKELYAGIAEIINEMKNKDFFEQKRIARSSFKSCSRLFDQQFLD